MKLINSRGRVLLEVYSAYGVMTPHGLDNVFYVFRGDGCGGRLPLSDLNNTIETIKADNPSAKVIGFLPEPEVMK